MKKKEKNTLIGFAVVGVLVFFGYRNKDKIKAKAKDVFPELTEKQKKSGMEF